MIRTDPAAETALCAAYREQAARYRQAVALGEELPALLQKGGEAHADHLSRVMALLADIAAIEAGIRTSKEHWVARGGRPGADLRTVLEEVMQLLERLRAAWRLPRPRRLPGRPAWRPKSKR